MHREGRYSQPAALGHISAGITSYYSYGINRETESPYSTSPYGAMEDGDRGQRQDKGGPTAPIKSTTLLIVLGVVVLGVVVMYNT